MTPALRDALEQVYARFRAPAPTRIDGCPCCIDRKGVKALHTKGLRELSEQDLGAYAASVFLTVGEARDFRYFLPRILELAITCPSFSIGLEVVVGKLALADWTSWPGREQQAVKALLDAWFNAAAAQCEAGWDGYDGTLDDLLCGIGRAGLDPVAYIERLLTEDLGFALAVLWEENRETIAREGRLSNPFWEDAPQAHAAALARLRAADIQTIVA